MKASSLLESKRPGRAGGKYSQWGLFQDHIWDLVLILPLALEELVLVLLRTIPVYKRSVFFFFFCEPIYKHPNSNEPFGVPISHRFC